MRLLVGSLCPTPASIQRGKLELIGYQIKKKRGERHEVLGRWRLILEELRGVKG